MSTATAIACLSIVIAIATFSLTITLSYSLKRIWCVLCRLCTLITESNDAINNRLNEINSSIRKE